MKEKGYVPHVAGTILELRLDDKGRVYQVGWNPVFFEEEKEDWKNWPVPSEFDVMGEPEEVTQTLYKLEEVPDNN